MPKLTIDNQTIEVPRGTKVIDAAEQLGIMIPRFCYHPALGAVGACRVCAVKVREGGRPGIAMSCMLDAADGMVISTTDAEAVDFRRHVIEWLMLSHPHDCPVCDEGGHCLLQDMTISGGHGLRRFRGVKRTYRDQELGPLVAHEMNRCIQCYRCVRYYREFTGYADLGVMGIGARVYYGRTGDGTLESPFAGNLVDICPTGVYTDKPSRYKGRRWDFERTPAVCIHCSLGCRLTVSARYREIVRHEARYSPAVNGHFICDRGRYAYPYASAPGRPRRARVDGESRSLKKALDIAAERLNDLAARHGPDAVGLVGSERSTLATLGALVRTAADHGWTGPVFWPDAATAGAVQTAVAGFDAEVAVSMEAIAQADAILLAGADPLREAPMLALALRQAQRQGAWVGVLDPRPVDLPLAGECLPLQPERLAATLSALKAAIETGADARANEDIAGMVAALKRSQNPVIVCGTDLPDAAAVARAADLVRGLRAGDRRAGLFYLLPGPNAFGAALADPDGANLENLVAQIEEGRLRALVVVEKDVTSRFADDDRLQAALRQLELLVVMDYIDSPTTRVAHILLPTQTAYETGGMWINNEGRLQAAPAALAGGLPVLIDGKGDHPPRIFGDTIPGDEPGPAWGLLAALSAPAAESTVPLNGEDYIRDLAALRPALILPPDLAALPAEGVRLAIANQDMAMTATPAETSAGEKGRSEGLKVVFTEDTFGTESLSALSPPLQARTPHPPCLWLHTQDAGQLGLRDGQAVCAGPPGDETKWTVRTSERMAAGIVVLPRQHLSGWSLVADADGRLPADYLRPAGDDESC